MFLSRCCHFDTILIDRNFIASFLIYACWINRSVTAGVTLYRNRPQSVIHMLKSVQTLQNWSACYVLLISFVAIVENLHCRKIIGWFSCFRNGLLLTVRKSKLFVRLKFGFWVRYSKRNFEVLAADGCLLLILFVTEWVTTTGLIWSCASLRCTLIYPFCFLLFKILLDGKLTPWISYSRMKICSFRLRINCVCSFRLKILALFRSFLLLVEEWLLRFDLADILEVV